MDIRPSWIVFILTFILSNQMFAEQISATREPQSQAVIRTEGSFHHLSLSPNRKQLAFTNADGQSLRILDLVSQEVIEITPHKTGPGFFWSPDGIRLFYRELIREGTQIFSELSAYDTLLNKRVAFDSLKGSSGSPILNPFDHTLLMIHEKGILQKRLEFPGERFAKWQKQRKTILGNWLASQAGVLWLGELGLELKKIADDSSGLSSFAISPDGRRVAWATQAGRVYAALDGGDATLIGEGKDPSWHPYRTILVYTAARKIGSKVYDYDLRFSNLSGQSRALTHTQDLSERWPVWLDANTLLYTGEKTTDLFKLNFQDLAPIAHQSPIRDKQ